MVQAIEEVEIDVVFLTYNPMIDIYNPIIKEDTICVAGSYELKIHREYKRKQKKQMGSDAYRHYKWYSLILKTELNSADFNSKLKIVHRHIESSDPKVYTLDGKLYKAVSLIFGPEKINWYYANSGQNSTYQFGSRFHKLPVYTKISSPVEIASKGYIPNCACTFKCKFSKIIEESEIDLAKEKRNDIIVYSYPIAANGNQEQLV